MHESHITHTRTFISSECTVHYIQNFFQLADQAFEGHHLSNSLNQSFHFSGYEKHYAFLGANILTLTL